MERPEIDMGKTGWDIYKKDNGVIVISLSQRENKGVDICIGTRCKVTSYAIGKVYVYLTIDGRKYVFNFSNTTHNYEFSDKLKKVIYGS